MRYMLSLAWVGITFGLCSRDESFTTYFAHWVGFRRIAAATCGIVLGALRRLGHLPSRFPPYLLPLHGVLGLPSSRGAISSLGTFFQSGLAIYPDHAIRGVLSALLVVHPQRCHHLQSLGGECGGGPPCAGGAVGALCYARLLGMSWGAAVFCAVAFQFMGCQYNNLQHPDMIRAYAYLPWLMWASHVKDSETHLMGRHWLLPVFTLLFVTGAYQGNLIAHSFVLALWVLMSAIRAVVIRRDIAKQLMILYGQMVGLGVMGLLLASAYLWPTYLMMDYQTRSEGIHDLRHIWDISFWHTLIMTSHQEGVYTWQAMISAFVTVPVFVLLFFMRWGFLRSEWPLVFMTTLSVLLAMGHTSPVYSWWVDQIPMLGYSRLLSSDYRGLFCFGLILLAGKLWDEYQQGELSGIWAQRFICCAGVLVFYLVLGILGEVLSSRPELIPEIVSEDYPWTLWPLYQLLLFHSRSITIFDASHWGIALLQVLVFFMAIRWLRDKSVWLLLVVISLEFFSGFWHWHAERGYWQLRENPALFYAGVENPAQPPMLSVFTPLLTHRPACYEPGGEAWRPYLLGEFMCNVKDALIVKPRVVVDRSLPLYRYMIQEGRPLSVDQPTLSRCEPEWLDTAKPEPEKIQQIHFGLQDIQYQVNAADNFCFVENELFFPGWSGHIAGQSGEIQAQSYCGALRSWCLPAGEYVFETRYETPGLRVGLFSSALALLIYVVLCVFFYWRRR